MSEIDVVVCGATGFTGKRVLKELISCFSLDGSLQRLKIGAAGRSLARLEEAVLWAGGKPGDDVALVEADVAEPESLARMCARASLVLNCVGPYRLYGEPVVAACVEAGCDYLDITGEPEFMEKMEAKYHEVAAKRGSLVLSGCGFDSIPAEMGVLYAKSRFPPTATLGSIVSYLTLHFPTPPGLRGNFPTYQSAVLGFGSVEELQRLRKQRRAKGGGPKIPGPRPQPNIHLSKDLGAWALPFPGADASVVRRMQAALAEGGGSGGGGGGVGAPATDAARLLRRPAHFAAFFTIRSIFRVVMFLIYGMVFKLLAGFSWGRDLLLSFPELFSGGIFSRAPPSAEQLAATSFSMLFQVSGYTEAAAKEAAMAKGGRKKLPPPDKKIVTRVTGPEPGYVATPIILVQCAITLLKERDNLLKGGVVTPGTAFAFSCLRERLQANGIKFEDVEL